MLDRRLLLGAAAFLVAERADAAHRLRLQGLERVVLEREGRVQQFLDGAADDGDAVGAHEGGALVADHVAQILAALRGGDEMRLAVDRHAVAEEAAMHGQRLVVAPGDGEERRVGRMKMGYGDRVRPRRVQRRVDGPFARRPHLSRQRLAVEARGDHVPGLKIGLVGARARREQHPLRRGIEHADMAVQAQQSLHREDARAGGQVLAKFAFRCHGNGALLRSTTSLPGLGPGIHVFLAASRRGWRRDKPDHDEITERPQPGGGPMKSRLPISTPIWRTRL